VGTKKQKLDLDRETQPLASPFDDLAVTGLPEHSTEELPMPVSEIDTQPVSGHEVILRREKAGRGGKAVIVISEFPNTWDEEELKDRAAKLKKHCSCGGTVKEREVEIQGEKAGEVASFLRRHGFRVRGLGV